MNRDFRLTSATDIRRVRRTGKSYAHPLAVLIVRPNGSARSRYGVTAGKSIGSAVARNRAKRRMREVLRELHAEIEAGVDLVLIARPGLAETTWPELEQAVRGLIKRAGLASGAK